MQTLEEACEEGEHFIKKLKVNCSSLPLLQHQDSIENFENCTSSESLNIFQQFLDILPEPSSDTKKAGVLKNSHLLEKLVAKERLNTLILNLHAGYKGYSLSFRIHPRNSQSLDDTTTSNSNNSMIETKEWPYDEDMLLRYIDDEELPPYLAELIETHYSFLFYNGCVIAEIRDYRQYYPKLKCDIHHILLRPTLKSLLADINNLVDDKIDLGGEERQQLESQLLTATHPTLCLDPDTSVGAHLARFNNRRQTWNTPRFKSIARHTSFVSATRKRRLNQFTQRPGLQLHDFLCRTKRRSSAPATPVVGLEAAVVLMPPTEPVAIGKFKAYQQPKETGDFLPQLVEEYVLETNTKEKGRQRVYHIKLSILQRPSDSEYLGELYLDRDHKKNERNGVACRFSLGSRANANRYIHQFTEIFTESGKKSVRIWYGLSPGYKERGIMTQPQAQLQTSQTNLPQHQLTFTQSIQSESTVNGSVNSRISIVQQTPNIQNTSSSVPILQGHLSTPMSSSTSSSPSSSSTSSQISTRDREILAIKSKLQNIGDHYQQQQKLRNHPAIINLLNSSPVNNISTDASAVTVLNQRTNSLLSPKAVPLARKMTFSNVTNARNLITSVNNNNNRMNLGDLTSPQHQTITLTSVSSGGNYTNFKPSSAESNKALQALLVGTPSADRPDIVGSNTNTLFLEKLTSTPASPPSTTHYIQSLKSGGTVQYMVQSPTKMSPPTTTNTATINLAQLQSLSGMQVQLLGFPPSSGTSLLVSMPVVTTSTSTSTMTQAAGGIVGGQTVVFSGTGNANLAQLVPSGVKGIGQSGIRAQGSGSQSYQLVAPLQRQNTQRTTPITLKMASQNSTAASQSTLTQHLQKQAHYQQYQQLCLNPQANLGGARIRRRSNASDTQ